MIFYESNNYPVCWCSRESSIILAACCFKISWGGEVAPFYAGFHPISSAAQLGVIYIELRAWSFRRYSSISKATYTL